MTPARRLVSIFAVGLVAGGLGLAPRPPSVDANVVAVGALKGAKDGGGRVAGAARNQGAVNGSGNQPSGKR